MRLWVFSDLHMGPREASAAGLPDAPPDADACVIAGDLSDSMQASLLWVGREIRPHMPVVFVPGNHEFFGTSIEAGRREAARMAGDLGIALLDDAVEVIGGVRFVGGTLWTDYAVSAGEGDRAEAVRLAMSAARARLSDHTQIDLGEVREGIIPRPFAPRDAAALHETTRGHIDGVLARPHDGPTVVVTHHAPHRGSIHERWRDAPTTPAYASDLSGIILARKPDLWLHGHVHDPFDYRAGSTRIVCNPRGFGRGAEGWDRRKVIEIGSDDAG